MKKIIIIIFLLIVMLILLRVKTPTQGDYLAKINDYTITPQEFNEEFLASAYAKNDSQESRREFLEILIQRKLIIQDAQAKGIDKDREFLKSIERFWEQSLLKLVLDKKSKEIAESTSIPDSAVVAEYNKLKNEGKADKPYEEMHNQIKWSLTQAKESEAIERWLESLYGKANIQINSKHFPNK